MVLTPVELASASALPVDTNIWLQLAEELFPPSLNPYIQAKKVVKVIEVARQSL